MKFFCPELEPEKGNIFAPLMEVLTNRGEYVATVDGNLQKYAQMVDNSGNGSKTDYLYGLLDVLKQYAGYKTPKRGPMTISQLSTALGITIDTNFIDANNYYWNIGTPYEIKTNMWFTILTDSGIMFAVPKRSSSSKPILFDRRNVLSQLKLSTFTAGFNGDSGQDITIGLDTSKVSVATITSAQKKYCLDKYYAKSNVLTIQTNYNANPLDYVSYDGEIYLAISKIKKADGVYWLTMVKEVDGTYSHGTGNINISLKTYILARRSTALTCSAGDTIMYYNTEDYDTLGEFTTEGSTYSIFQPATDKVVCVRMQTYVKTTPPQYGVEPFIEVANVGSSSWSILTKTHNSRSYGYNTVMVGRDSWIFKALQGKKYRFKTYINPGRDLYTSADGVGYTYATNIEIIEILGDL